MSWILLLAVGAFIVAALASFGGRRLSRAMRNGTVEELVAALEAVPERGRVNAYSRTIQSLWDGYDRERALELIRAFAERFPKEKIAQYWMDKAITVEPKISSRWLDDDFVLRYYEPHVAQKCGTYG